MAKRIVLCFDGTWNTPDEGDADRISTATNVSRFHDAVADRGADGVLQMKRYYIGVGTSWFERLAGGGLGVGTSRTMMQGYKDLSEAYDDQDDIFLLGFSRGAYTARALAGVITRCGLLHKELAARAGRPDDPNLAADDLVLGAYQHWTRRGRTAAERDAADLFSANFCRPVRIAFLGVWDTVGALGIPGHIFKRLNRSLVEFPDLDLSPIVDRAYQAVAVDEHRDTFAATLWERPSPKTLALEQCWFAGDHCDVGGGHPIRRGDVRLADIPLAWMQEKAQQAGLGLTPVAPDVGACVGTACNDTYAMFLGGAWAANHPRYLRPVLGTPAGGETIHPSLLERRRHDSGYRPRNPGLPPV